MASPKHIAVDLGSQSVALGTFSTGPGGVLVLEQFQSSELLPDPAADGSRPEQCEAALGAMAKSMKVSGPAHFAVTSQSVFTRFVKLPPLDVDQLDQIVGFEAQQQVPFPLTEAVWDYQTLGNEGDPEIEVMLVAIKSDELEAVNHIIRSSGFQTGKVDLAPLAIYNAFRYNYPDVDQPVLLIDMGARSTNLIYSEGKKFFVRTINTGTREITQSISKEFGISFLEAEAKKQAQGFVALGGAYADHEDPEVAAMSKVIRNSLTRLHSEIIRTNNFYRSNQGGSAPTVAFLCGIGARLPYLNEFFQEKLKVPVEYFDALRNVELGRKVDHAEVMSQPWALGELIGLGLRGAGVTPVEIDLVPRIVARERVVDKRAPLFWMAGLSFAILLGATGFYLQKAAEYVTSRKSALDAEVSSLKRFSTDLQEQDERLEKIRERSKPYSEAVLGRVYWITTFRDLSEAMVDDNIWFVEMQPMSGTHPLIAEPRRAGEAALELAADPLMAEVPAGQHVIDSIQIKGLWRDNQQGGSKVVYSFLDRLRESKRPFFDLVERDPATGQPALAADGTLVKKFTDGELLNPINHGTGNDRQAYDFTLKLPLPEGRRIEFTK